MGIGRHQGGRNALIAPLESDARRGDVCSLRSTRMWAAGVGADIEGVIKAGVTGYKVYGAREWDVKGGMGDC